MKLNRLIPLSVSLALLQLNPAYAQDANNQTMVKIFNRPFYVSLLAGYARAPWAETAAGTHGTSPSATISFPKNGDGGFLWGADVGYQFKPGLSFEIGAYQLPKVVVDIKFANPPGIPPISGDISSMAIYLAGRIDYKLTDTMSLFSKFGIAEQQVTVDKVLDSPGGEGMHSNSCLGLFYSAGLSYQQNKNLALTLQFARIPGQAKHDDNEDAYSMNADLITAGAQFTFK